MNKCYLTIFCNHYRDWRQPFKPCNESYHENQNKKIQIDSVFPVCITILCCSIYRVSIALLHFLTAHITGFSLFCKQFFPVQFIDFPCYYKNSHLHEIPCSYSHFFLLRLQGIPCLYYTFLMLILIFTPFHHYIIFPVIAT